LSQFGQDASKIKAYFCIQELNYDPKSNLFSQ
jgi:hypothetical protein